MYSCSVSYNHHSPNGSTATFNYLEFQYRLSMMEGQKANTPCPGQKANTPCPGYHISQPLSTNELANKPWHAMSLIPEGPQFIGEIYKAKGLTKGIVKRAKYQMEKILQSRPTVKPLLKRRRLLSQVHQAAEKPVPGSEPSLPIAEPSSPVSSETITIYSGITDTPSVTRLADVAHPQNCSSSLVATTVDTSTVPSKPIPVAPKLGNNPKLTAPPSMNVNASPAMICHSTSNHIRHSSPPCNSGFKSIFDPETITTSSRSPIAKKSTTPRTVFKNRLLHVKRKHCRKDLRVTLYDFAKDYGTAIKFNEWNGRLSSKKKSEADRKLKLKEKRKNKSKGSKLKCLPDFSQKNMRDVSKNGVQPPAKCIVASDSFEKPVQANSVPKVTIVLKNTSGNPRGFSSVLDDKANGCNSSHKTNIVSADHGSCFGTMIEPKQSLKRRSSSPPETAPPEKKRSNIKYKLPNKIPAEKESKSEKFPVIQIPQTSSSKDKVANSTGPQLAPETTTLPPLVLNVLAPEGTTKLGEPKPNNEPAVPAGDPNPRSTQTPTQVKDKPVISFHVYQARRSSLKSGSGSNSSSPTLPGVDSVNSKKSGQSSPSKTPEGEESYHKPKLSTNKDLTHSPKYNGITSSNSNCRSPEYNSSLKHKIASAASPDTPKKSKSSWKPIPENTENTPVESKESGKIGKESKESASPAATKSLSEFKQTEPDRTDPRKKRFLSTLVENNNNSNFIGFETAKSIPIDSTATVELNIISGEPLSLHVMHKNKGQSELSLVKWDGLTSYSCFCALTFSLYSQWAEHCRSCTKNSM